MFSKTGSFEFVLICRLFGFCEFGQPIVLLRDPELIKQITIKDFEYFEDHSSFITEEDDRLLGHSLIMLKGQKWRQMRATLSPSFTGSKMRLMCDMISECGDATINFLMKETENESGKTSWEMKDFFMRYTNDVIASCAFGIRVNSFTDPHNAFLECGEEVKSFTMNAKFLIKLGFSKVMPKLAKLFFTDLFGAELYNFFCSMVVGTMDERKKKNIYRPDMINILMELQKEAAEAREGVTVNENDIPVKRTWTKDEIVAQCFLFYVGGFDSTSLALSFFAYEMAINPDVQQRLFKEIVEMDEKLNGKPIQYDNLKEMTYLNQVVQETVRKWTFGIITDRECVKDYIINNIDGKKITIKKGTYVWLPITAIHHDSKYHPDPFKFDPSRFSEQNKTKMLPGTFLPFGIGPRQCVGMSKI